MVLCLLIIGAVSAALFTHTSSARTLAAPSSPPPPPTYVPTPIGGPPAPPTDTPTATVSAGVTATVSPTSATNALVFSLDAARVSKVNNPGDLRGLLSVTRGSKTWLMIYYTIKSLPRKMHRQATYSVLFRGKTVFKAIFKDSLKRSEIGRFSKYTQFNVPRSLPYGKYVYLSTLTIGNHHQNKSWRFSIAKQEREAAL
jgi:hypothetical protein